MTACRMGGCVAREAAVTLPALPPRPELRALDDDALLLELRGRFAPGAPEPDLAALAAGLRGRELAVPVPGGAVRVDLGDWTSLLLVRLGAWEPHLVALARALIRPGDVTVDAGAHVGAWTLVLAALAGAGGRVLAYEPLPDSAARARAAVAAGGLDERAQVIEAALGEREGRARLHRFSSGPRFPGPDAMLCSLTPGPGYEGAGALEVRVTALDDAPLARLDFLKLDTEGAELAVLRGARALLARSPRARILVELHAEELAAQGLAPADVFRELEAQGFSLLDLRPEGGALLARRLRGDAPTTHHVLASRDGAELDVPLLP
jgi:FkbM family methyltransferase